MNRDWQKYLKGSSLLEQQAAMDLAVVAACLPCAGTLMSYAVYKWYLASLSFRIVIGRELSEAGH